MKRYIYKNPKTGQKIYSDYKIHSEDLELVREVRNTKQSYRKGGRQPCPVCGEEYKNLASHMRVHN